MNDNGHAPQPDAAIIIRMDGTMEQLLPLSIAFYEQLARGMAQYVERLKGQAVITPPEKALEVE
jgi:hypothetical protein